MTELQLALPEDEITVFCKKWQIRELALFGSAIRDDFRSDSDVDVLVSFAPTAQWTLFDHVDMQSELSAILDRDVDLVTRRGIEHSRNYIRRQAILDSAQVVYAAS